MRYSEITAVGYIDVVVSVLVSMMIIVLALNVFSFLTIKQDMDYFAKEMITATANGTTIGRTIDRYYELEEETGYPQLLLVYNILQHLRTHSSASDTITVTLNYDTYLKGFGIFKIPITLTAKHSGLSQKYWK